MGTCVHRQGGHKTIPLEGARRSAVRGGKRKSWDEGAQHREAAAGRNWPFIPQRSLGMLLARACLSRELAVPPCDATQGAAGSAALGLYVPPGEACRSVTLWDWPQSSPPPSIHPSASKLTNSHRQSREQPCSHSPPEPPFSSFPSLATPCLSPPATSRSHYQPAGQEGLRGRPARSRPDRCR